MAGLYNRQGLVFIILLMIGINTQGKEIWSNGEISLTSEDMISYFRLDDYSSPEELELANKVHVATPDLFDFCVQFVLNNRDAALASKALNVMVNSGGDLSKYEADFRELLSDDAVRKNTRLYLTYSHILACIGEDEDGVALLPLLDRLLSTDNFTSWSDRDSLLSILTHIGGEKTLQGLEAMLPKLEERHKADLEKILSPQTRELMLDVGITQADQLDSVLAESCEREKRDHKRLLAKIEKLREKVRLQKDEGASAALQQAKPEEGGAAVPSPPTDSPATGGDTDPAGSGEGSPNLVIWAVVILLALLCSGYVIHRKRSRT